MIKILIIIALLFISCSSSSDRNNDCIIRDDPYDDTIKHIECPDGTMYSTKYGAGLENGDIVDIETRVDILEVK